MELGSFTTKAVLHLLQLIGGLACFCILQVDRGLFSCPRKYPEEMMMAQVASVLDKTAFTFMLMSFAKLVTRFPRNFADIANRTRTSFSQQQPLESGNQRITCFTFEFLYHSMAFLLYCFTTTMLYIRLGITGLASELWNVTAAAVFGDVACLAHVFYGQQLEKEYRQRVREAEELVNQDNV